MTSIDELFKKSGLPSKRKLDPIRDPTEIYKSARLDPDGHSNRASRADDDLDETEAGPAPPPDDQDDDEDGADYGPAAPPDDVDGAGGDDDDDDDDEGRFFGGGITAQEAEVLDYVERADAGTADVKVDAGWLRRAALSLERRITRNAEQRARFADQPARFIESEADLDADVKALSSLAEHPELYPEFVRLRCPASLAGLLAHENTDIAIDVVEILGELTDEDVAATDEQWGALVGALLEADLLGLLVSNLSRLDEEQEADRSGVYYALGIVENLCSHAETAETVGAHEALLRWLLDRARRAERPVSQNKQYAAEVLAILVQSSAANRRRLAALGAVDALLQLVAVYRKHDPEKGGEEEEYVEDLFEALTCLVDEPEGRTKFVEAEGVELSLIMLREGRMSKGRSLRMLDHAVGGSGGGGGAEVCQKLVEEGGLKTTFTLFMKKHDGETTEHLLSIFSWMLRLLPADSAERIRTLAKFVEKDYEKTARLVRLRREYAARVGAAEERIEQERRALSAEDADDMADEWFSRRLDAGLFCLQSIDVILAWLVAEDDGARRKIEALLADRDETLALLRSTIQEQMDGIDVETEDGKDTRDMLSTLVEFLQ